jgi:hypothetical protein
MDHDRNAQFQLVWGLLLVIAGIGLLFRIPQVMPQIRQIEYFSAVIPFIYFCMYFIALFLIAGGVRKLYLNSQKLKPNRPTRK